jgi:hypothetical protein
MTPVPTKKAILTVEFLLERRHNERFSAIMDRHLPPWRAHREELNAAPLAHETWSY